MSANLKKTSSSKLQARKQVLKKSTLPFTNENYILFVAGLALIIVGYIGMATGPVYGALSITISPVVVCIGYLVLIPMAILYRKKEAPKE